MKIGSIEIQNFRSIGQNAVVIAELEDFNLFIGKNNSGKSNVIKVIPFLGDIFKKLPDVEAAISPGARNSLASIDHLFYKGEKSISLSATFSFENPERKEMLSGLPEGEFKQRLESLKNLLTLKFTITRSGENDVSYSLRRLVYDNKLLLDFEEQLLIGLNDDAVDPNTFGNAYRGLKSTKTVNYIYTILSLLKSHYEARLRIIKAVRKIGATLPNSNSDTSSSLLTLLDFDGDRVIDEISSWQTNTPSGGRRNFRKINKFVSSLLDEKVELVASEDKRHLYIERENGEEEAMSYKSWGSSIEELIVLMVSIISSPSGSAISFEEPEIHIDPFMQRKLINFLKDETDHQYFISSHSNVLINEFASKDSTIYRVFIESAETKVVKADETALNSALDDLGVKASDMLQTNGVIWVEGPSDRIFLNKWISLLKPKLVEGLHYSIMFYGGKLLSHLKANNEETEADINDFIKLLRLNRNLAIVIDSDKNSEADKINLTKERIVGEVASLGENAFAWTTDGREIENYLPPELFKTALGISGMGKYKKISDLKNNYVKTTSAKKLVEAMDDKIFSNTDLKRNIETLIQKISLWNVDRSS